MQVNIVFLEIVLLHAVIRCNRTHIGQCNLRRLLHDIAHLTRHLQHAFARHDIDLDLQCIAADARPRQTAHDTDLCLISGCIEEDFLASQIMIQIPLCHADRRFLLLQHLSGCLAADIANPALQIPDSGFPGVAVNHFLQRRTRDI